MSNKKYGYPYKTDRKHFVRIYVIIILWALLNTFIYFTIGSKFIIFSYLLFTIAFWAYTEYHHSIIMSPLTFNLGKVCGKIETLEMVNKDAKKLRSKWKTK